MKQFKTVDGKRLKKGDRIWCREGTLLAKPYLWLGAVLVSEMNAATGKVLTSTLKYKIVGLNFEGKKIDPIVGWLTDADHCASTKEWWTERVEIQGRVFYLGQTVWIWREGNQPSLVRKTVCALKAPRGHFSRYNPEIQCTYEDNYWPRKENPQKLYLSEDEALAACPEKAQLLEQAIMRAGRRQGIRKAA